MEVTAKLNYLRISPRKMRLLTDLIRGKKVGQAKSFLNFKVKRGALPLKKLLESAIANAKNNFSLDESTLVISEIFVDEGPKLKRWHAMSRGRAFPIQKKTSHVTIVLEGSGKTRTKKVEAEDTEVALRASKESEKETVGQKKTTEKKFKVQKDDFAKKSNQRGLNKIFRRKAI